MKTLRMVVGIIACALCIAVIVQSCAVGTVNAIGEAMDAGESDSSGTIGFMVAVFMLVGGIVGIAGRKRTGAAITSACFFFTAAITGFAGANVFPDLGIYGFVNLIFTALFLMSIVVDAKNKKKNASLSDKPSEVSNVK